MSKLNNSGSGLLKKVFSVWIKQYHGYIPADMLKRYIIKFRHERYNIRNYGQRFFNPENNEEYQKWLTFQTYEASDESVKVHDLYVCGKLDLSNVKEEFCAVHDGDIDVYPEYAGYLKYLQDADAFYTDYDYLKDGQRQHPCCEPDFSYDTLRGFNYIGRYWIVRTELLKQFEGQPWNPYRWLLELSDQKIRFRHISKILYGCRTPETCQSDTVRAYMKDHSIECEVRANPDGITDTVLYKNKKQPLISIVIPTRDGKDSLAFCISSILKETTYPNYEIIIMDNGSCKTETLDYFSEIQKQHRNIHIYRLDVPFNFSKINNEAVKKSHGDYIVMLNNDTSIITGDWLEQMMAYASRSWIGTVGVMMYYPDDTIQHAGVISGKGGGFAHRYYRCEHDVQGYDHTLDIPYDVSCNTAACLMISRKKFDEVSGMNEELTVQFNDCDFCLRVLEKGYFNIFLPYVKLYHYESKSRGIDKAPEKVKRFTWEVDYVNKKWDKYIQHDPFYNDQYDKNYDYRLISGTGSN